MASASIDTYLHWRVRKVELKGKTLNKALKKLEVPFGELVAMARADVKARKEGIANRPIIKARNVLHQRILQDSYQSQSGIERALSMCGITKYWAGIADELGEPAEEVKKHINSLARRRNAIVHEGDIQRKSKPRDIKHESLTADKVREELRWVRAFVNALGVVAP